MVSEGLGIYKRPQSLSTRTCQYPVEPKTSLLVIKVLGTVATDPVHQGHGAASLLLKWGCQKSDQERVVSYLESTVETVSFYEKHGFVALDSLLVTWSTPSPDGDPTHSYKEICMARGLEHSDIC
jgi:GNAT superfamily N-acetyltransferase